MKFNMTSKDNMYNFFAIKNILPTRNTKHYKQKKKKTCFDGIKWDVK